MATKKDCNCNLEPTVVEIKMECARMVFETGTDYQKKEWDSTADKLYAWITRIDSKSSSKTARKKADQKS